MRSYLLDSYGHGNCASLAMAVLEHLELPCVVFYKRDPEDNSAVHVANRVDGGYLDIYGIVSKEQIEARYGCDLVEVLDASGEDTAVQFEVCMGEWTDSEGDPFGARRAWRDCGQVMLQHIGALTHERQMAATRLRL